MAHFLSAKYFWIAKILQRSPTIKIVIEVPQRCKVELVKLTMYKKNAFNALVETGGLFLEKIAGNKAKIKTI